jgi:hypothetical protein
MQVLDTLFEEMVVEKHRPLISHVRGPCPQHPGGSSPIIVVPSMMSTSAEHHRGATSFVHKVRTAARPDEHHRGATDIVEELRASSGTDDPCRRAVGARLPAEEVIASDGCARPPGEQENREIRVTSRALARLQVPPRAQIHGRPQREQGPRRMTASTDAHRRRGCSCVASAQLFRRLFPMGLRSKEGYGHIVPAVVLPCEGAPSPRST